MNTSRQQDPDKEENDRGVRNEYVITPEGQAVLDAWLATDAGRESHAWMVEHLNDDEGTVVNGGK